MNPANNCAVCVGLAGIFAVTFHTYANREDFWHGFCQKYEFFGAILHDFCKMRAFSIENVAVTGRGVKSNINGRK